MACMTAGSITLTWGNASIIAPGGGVLAGPVREETGLVHAEPNLAAIAETRRTFDVAGHYSRPDVFTLRVDSTRKQPVKFR